MAEFQSIPLADIFVPERLRHVEEPHAEAMMMSIAKHGLLQPVGVRRTPNGAAKYTLVFGAHRRRAVELLGEAAIDATIIEADKTDAQLAEIVENLFHNDLSVIDRAVFVGTYRELWEQKYGAINPKGGRPSGKRPQVVAVIDSPIDILAADAADGFNAHVAARMGISTESIRRLNLIAKMAPQLRNELRGKPQADNQSVLLKLAKMEPSKQKQYAHALQLAKGDFAQAVKAVEPLRVKPSRDTIYLAKLTDAWGRTNEAVRQEFLALIGAVLIAKGGADEEA